MHSYYKKIFCSCCFLIGFFAFILQVFVFEYPDGNLGLLLCIIEVIMMLESIIYLYKTSKRFQQILKNFLDIFFSF